MASSIPVQDDILVRNNVNNYCSERTVMLIVKAALVRIKDKIYFVYFFKRKRKKIAKS